MSQLDTDKQISVNVIKCDAEIIRNEQKIFSDYGFVFNRSEFENGVPVDKLCRL